MAAQEWAPIIQALTAGESLDYGQSYWLMDQVMSGELGEARLASFLTAMAIKGATVDEIHGLADGIALAALANRIEDDDICCLRHLTLLKRRTPGTGKARILYEVHDLCYAEKLAWRNDESRFRILFPNPFERL